MSVLWRAREQLFLSFCSVYVLGAAPIGIHLLARFYNAAGADVIGPDIVADGYLYAFIVALSGIVDSIDDSKKSASMAFLVFSVIASVGNYTAQLDGAVTRPDLAQHLVLFIEVFLPIVVISYARHKLCAVHRAARTSEKT